MKRMLGVAALASLLLLGACGDDASPLETVRAAADATSGSGTFRYEGTVESSEGAGAGGTDLEGAFDPEQRLGSATVDASQFGIPGLGEVDAIYDFNDGFVIYMHLAELFEGAPAELAGVEWVRMDLDELARQAGLDLDFGALVNSASNDPTSGMQQLRGATKVDEVGTEEVRGVETTHYEVTVDLDKAAAEAPDDQREALQALADLYTEKTLSAEVWIDGDDRVRRMHTSQDLSKLDLPDNIDASMSPFQGVLTTQFEYFGFGDDVEVELPGPDEVIDFADLMKLAGEQAEQSFSETGEAIN